jgi:hypothetical protein
MFRKNKNVPVPTSPEAEPVLTTPVPEQAEAVDLSAKRLALTEHLGELARSSTEAFNRELLVARERGLSPEDQEAYIKSLWAERKIPRILATAYRSHSTGLRVVRPEKIEEIKISDLDEFNPSSPRVDSPMVDRDFDRAPEPRKQEDEPVIFLDTLRGYFGGKIDTRFMPEVTPESFERLQAMAAVLEEASVVEVNPAQ